MRVVIAGYVFSLSTCIAQYMASLLSGTTPASSMNLAGHEVVTEVGNCMGDKNVPACTILCFQFIKQKKKTL